MRSRTAAFEDAVQQRVVLADGAGRQAVLDGLADPALDQAGGDRLHGVGPEVREEVGIEVAAVRGFGGELEVVQVGPPAVLDAVGEKGLPGGGVEPGAVGDFAFGGGAGPGGLDAGPERSRGPLGAGGVVVAGEVSGPGLHLPLHHPRHEPRPLLPRSVRRPDATVVTVAPPTPLWARSSTTRPDGAPSGRPWSEGQPRKPGDAVNSPSTARLSMPCRRWVRADPLHHEPRQDQGVNLHAVLTRQGRLLGRNSRPLGSTTVRTMPRSRDVELATRSEIVHTAPRRAVHLADD